MIDGFLIEVIATASIVAGIVFLKFWRNTRDLFFLAFAASFIIEGLNRSAILLVDKPEPVDLASPATLVSAHSRGHS